MKLSFYVALAGFVLLLGQAGQAGTPKAPLPLVIYAEDGGKLPYFLSGYMGNAGAIKMNPSSTVNPHSGKTCLKVSYTASDNWGGVVWQNPGNNWGNMAGGWNLTGARTLSFWARGEKGSEVVSFLFGLIGKDKPNSDTGSGKVDKVALTKNWKKYTISLQGKNMSHIITGFAWTLGATGSPETFYLDDIRYD